MIQWMWTTHAIHHSHPATIELVVWRRYRSWTNESTSSKFYREEAKYGRVHVRPSKENEKKPLNTHANQNVMALLAHR